MAATVFWGWGGHYRIEVFGPPYSMYTVKCFGKVYIVSTRGFLLLTHRKGFVQKTQGIIYIQYNIYIYNIYMYNIQHICIIYDIHV